MTKIRAVLLDIDGTLLNSNDAHAHAWKAALVEVRGTAIPLEEVWRRVGMGADHLLPDLVGIDAESELGKRIAQRKDEIFARDYFEGLRPFPGARDLVAELKRLGFILTIVTSGSRTDLKKFVEKLAIGEFLTDPTSSDDAEGSKPDPDLIEAALEKLNLAPEEAILIGDTPYDIEAAKKANVATIGFLSGGWGREALAGAVEIYAGPADLLVQFSGSCLSGR